MLGSPLDCVIWLSYQKWQNVRNEGLANIRLWACVPFWWAEDNRQYPN